jgi:membrane protein implicated in regulation of membrane protease activity
MTPYQIWLVAALALFILEILTPGFVLANFAVGCVGAAIAAWMGAEVILQTTVFCVVSLLSFVSLRPMMRRFGFMPPKEHHTNMNALIGATALVVEPIEMGSTGRVKIHSDVWQAVSIGASVAAGAHVKVVEVRSTMVVVQP